MEASSLIAMPRPRPTRTAVGLRIRDLRKQRRWSQKELAVAAGVPRPWLSLVETGEIANPGGEYLDHVAEALGLTSRALRRGSDPAAALSYPARDESLMQQFAKLPTLIKEIALGAAYGAAERLLEPVRDDRREQDEGEGERREPTESGR